MTPRSTLARALCVLALAGAAPLAPAQTLPLTPAQKSNLGIVVAPVGAAGGVTLDVVGRVRLPPTALAVVAAGGDGLVTRLYTQAGDKVGRGAALVSLSMPGLAEARALAIQARLRADLADDNAARDGKLHAEGLIAEARLRATRSEAASARAAVAAANAQLRLLGAGRSSGAELTLTSPIAGSVLEVMAEPGARVAAGTALVKLADLSRLALEIPLTASQAAGVAVGQKLALADGTAGRIAALLPQLDAAQNVLARATLERTPATLRPGQTVRVALAAGNGGGRAVPTTAVVWKGKQAHVFVEVGQGFAATPVNVLRQNAGAAEVEGLAAGARVAVKGVAALKAKWLGE